MAWICFINMLMLINSVVNKKVFFFFFLGYLAGMLSLAAWRTGYMLAVSMCSVSSCNPRLVLLGAYHLLQDSLFSDNLQKLVV